MVTVITLELKKYLHSIITLKPLELDSRNKKKVHPTPCVICHVSRFTCHMSPVTYQMSLFLISNFKIKRKIYLKIFKFNFFYLIKEIFYKVVDLVG